MPEPTPTTTPTPTPVENTELLNSVRLLQNRGLLDKLTPSERFQMGQKVEPEMAKERTSILENKPTQSAMEWMKANLPEKTPVQVLGDVAKNVVVGVEKAYQPLPMVNALTPMSPHIPDDLATFNSLFNFPIIRGSELAARLFVPEGERPPLTTFAEVVKDHREMLNNLDALAPGVQTGTELGIGLGSAAELASAGIKYGKEVLKRAPEYAKKIGSRIEAMKASQMAQKAKNLTAQLLKEGEGPLSDAILSNPEKVLQMSRQPGNLSVNDMAIELSNKMDKIHKGLGQTVGEFRDIAFADNKTRIPVDPRIEGLIDVVKQRSTLDGKSVLPSQIQQQLDSAQKMARLGFTTPNQALVLTDTIDGIVEFANSGKLGSNAVKSANNTLGVIRGALKDMVRNSSGVGEEWAMADDAFGRFVDVSSRARAGLNANQEALVANLFTRNKTELRDNLSKSLDFMEYIDPEKIGHGEVFFNKLNQIRAAQRIKDVRMTITDPMQDNANEIVKRWTRRGERTGQALGTAGGYGLGFVSGGGNQVGGGVGAYVGERVLKAAGAQAGEYVGMKLANPERILQAAIKSKQLSAKARALAGDMNYLVQTFGPSASIAFLDIVGPIPAVNELISFTQKEGKDNGNGVRK